MGLDRYRELLRIPGVPGLLLAAFVARLPYGMFALALILLLRAEGFDYAEIGRITTSEIGTVKSRIHRGRLAVRNALVAQGWRGSSG